MILFLSNITHGQIVQESYIILKRVTFQIRLWLRSSWIWSKQQLVWSVETREHLKLDQSSCFGSAGSKGNAAWLCYFFFSCEDKHSNFHLSLFEWQGGLPIFFPNEMLNYFPKFSVQMEHTYIMDCRATNVKCNLQIAALFAQFISAEEHNVLRPSPGAD